jgi:hypothetical protein
MIDISDSKAKKICDLLKYFAEITADTPRTNKLDNARRVAGKMANYLNQKNYGRKRKGASR